jgi:hypothetical protein
MRYKPKPPQPAPKENDTRVITNEINIPAQPIGTIFEHNKTTYQVALSMDVCAECEFISNECGHSHCDRSTREDNNDVIYRRV